MEPVDVVQAYFDEVYAGRDPSAAERFIADPCLRHEHGQLIEMTLAQNIERIAHFLDTAPDLAYASPVLTGNGEYVTSCFDLMFDGAAISGIEVFRVVDARITETWNSTTQKGRWG